MQDSWFKRVVFIGPVLIGITIASYYLYLDYRPRQSSSEEQVNREVVGEILYAENNVKRQLGNEVMWEPIDKTALVYSKDSVRTGKDSNAAIKLSDSTIIEVGENSLIVLDKSLQNLSVNFKAGDISSSQTGKNLEIKVKDSIVKGEGADVKIKANMGADASIEVAKGRATLTDRNKKSVELSQADRAGLSETGVGQVSKIAIVLKSPEHRSKIQSNRSDLKQPFLWEVSGGEIKQEQLEISPDNLFSTDKTKLFKGHQGATVALGQGTYYWRVGWMAEKKMLYTDSRNFTVGADKRLELVYPENATHFDLEPEEDVVDLQWKCAIAVKVFVAEVATSADFKNITYSKAQTEPKVLVKDLPSQVYYWRVRAFGSKNEELAVSPTYSFTLKVKMPKLPELIKPLDELVWDTGEPVELSWKGMTKGTEYRVNISSDLDQRVIIKTKTVDTATFSWRWQNQGTYYWGVKAIGEHSASIGQSEIRKLVIKTKPKPQAFILTNPKDKLEILRDFSENPEPVLFQWQTTRNLPGPVSIFVSKTDDFKEVIKQDNITIKSVSLSLKTPSLYFWKLVSLAPDGKAIENSEVSSFSLKMAAKPPQLMQPTNKEVIEISEPTPVKFIWNSVPATAQYHIVVQRIEAKNGDKIPVLDRLVAETTITSSKLADGYYIWFVSAVDAQGQEGLFNHPFEFSMIIPEQLAAPKLNAPVVK